MSKQRAIGYLMEFCTAVNVVVFIVDVFLPYVSWRDAAMAFVIGAVCYASAVHWHREADKRELR